MTTISISEKARAVQALLVELEKVESQQLSVSAQMSALLMHQQQLSRQSKELQQTLAKLIQ